MTELRGIGVGKGIVLGKLHVWRRGRTPEREPGTGNPERERQRFQDACAQAGQELEALEQRIRESLGEEEAQVFFGHRMLLEDPLFAEMAGEILEKERTSAAWAAHQAGEQLAGQLEALEEAEWVARAADLRDVADRVVGILQHRQRQPLPEEPCILAAEDLTPSETAQMDTSRILGMAVSQGSLHCHTAILARSRNLPAVVALEAKPTAEWEGCPAALDAGRGLLILNPTREQLEELEQRREVEQQRQSQLQCLRGLPSVTRDGHPVSVCANVGNQRDLEAALAQGADGIGLFRTELLFLEADHWPAEEEQLAVYRRAVESMEGRQVVIRTLDIGADKQLSYAPLETEENPALGCRGIRFCLARPQVFRTQLRAIYRASAYGRAAILYPMIAGEEELRQVLDFSAQVRGELEQEGIPVGQVEQGIMVETPAAALMGDRLAGLVDFFSIGTNDLTQYTLAADRQNARTAGYFAGCHPAVWRLVEESAAAAARAGIWVGVCGDLAGDPAYTALLLRLGVRELSVAPFQVLEIRRQVRETDLSDKAFAFGSGYAGSNKNLAEDLEQS